MKVLRGLALGILGFLLFLSLSIFSLLFMLNSTILNANFVTAELDKFDVSALAGEVLSEQIPEEEFRTTLINTITELEPLVKEQVSATIYPIYDYLLGKSQGLDLAHTLRNTILSSDFVASLLDKLDLSSLAGEFLTEQLAGDIPEEMELLVESLDEVIIELEPWLKEQVNTAADPILDYLLGESQSLTVVISLEPVTESLKDNLREALLASPPAEFASVPPALLEQYIDQYLEEGLAEMIPPTIEIDESLIGTQTPAQLAEVLAEGEMALEEARQYVGYFQLVYKLLIVLIVLLIAGIVLLNRQVRSSTRKLGSIFLPCGILWLAGILIAKNFAGTQIAQLDIPSFLQAWLPQFVNDFLAPLQMLSIGLLAAGVVLLVVSFVYKPRQPSV